MSKVDKLVSSFNLKGQLTKIYRHKNQIKRIKLNTDDGHYWIKISKKLRAKVAHISCGLQLEKAKVLICQKSNCWNQGGRKVYETLESVLNDINLSEQISIKKSGCLKKCKRAPNLVMLPDKVHYTKVKSKQIKSFVHKHLITET